MAEVLRGQASASSRSLSEKEAQLLAVVKEIEAGRIQADAQGVAALPTTYANLTAGGSVYFERRTDGRLLVLFPTWYGKGLNLAGFLYASGPLVSADYYQVDWGSGGVVNHLQVGSIDYLTVEPAIGPWYRVERSVD